MYFQIFKEQTINQKTTFSHVILVSIVASLMLFSGFIISLFLLAVSAIIFPFAAFKIWRLQRQYQKNVVSAQTLNTEEGAIIEAEYVVVDNAMKD